MKNYYIRNWNEFQHYKDRNPSWIKFHYNILTSNDWIALEDEDRLTMIVCMLIASRNQGLVKNDPDLVQRTGRLSFAPDLNKLADCGFFIPATDDPSGASIPYTTEHPSVSSYSDSYQNKKEDMEKAREVLEYLVKVTGRNFSNHENILSCIKREKCSVEDCKKVIDFKAAQWKGKSMLEHLDARTPWRAKHFVDYLDEANAGPVKAGGASNGYISY